jgi:hypothetical protein
MGGRGRLGLGPGRRLGLGAFLPRAARVVAWRPCGAGLAGAAGAATLATAPASTVEPLKSNGCCSGQAMASACSSSLSSCAAAAGACSLAVLSSRQSTLAPCTATWSMRSLKASPSAGAAGLLAVEAVDALGAAGFFKLFGRWPPSLLREQLLFQEHRRAAG